MPRANSSYFISRRQAIKHHRIIDAISLWACACGLFLLLSLDLPNLTATAAAVIGLIVWAVR